MISKGRAKTPRNISATKVMPFSLARSLMWSMAVRHLRTWRERERERKEEREREIEREREEEEEEERERERERRDREQQTNLLLW